MYMMRTCEWKRKAPHALGNNVKNDARREYILSPHAVGMREGNLLQGALRHGRGRRTWGWTGAWRAMSIEAGAFAATASLLRWTKRIGCSCSSSL